MNVGDETYLHGSPNNEGSVRLLWVVDANGDGLPDAKLQSLVGGAWLDMVTPVTVPTATSAGHAINKAQLDAAIAAVPLGGGGTPAPTVVRASAAGTTLARAWLTILIVDATSAAFSVALPAAPQDGDRVLASYKSTASAANSVTLTRNGKLVQGVAQDILVDVRNSLELCYDATSGDWMLLGLTAGTTPAPVITSGTPILDVSGLGSSVVAAYGLRKLRAAYSGSAIRVQRSSDSTQQDIGFTSGDLDTSALLAFVGGGNGDVVKLYDQSGNARDQSLASGSTAMRIVTSGTLVTRGSSNHAAIRSISTTGGFSSAAFGSAVTGAAISAVSVWSPSPTAPSDNRVLSVTTTGQADYSAVAGIGIMFRLQGGANSWECKYAGNNYMTVSLTRGTSAAFLFRSSGTAVFGKDQSNTDTSVVTTSWNFNQVMVGATANNDPKFYTDDYWQEGVLWSVDLGSTNGDAALANQRTYYGVV